MNNEQFMAIILALVKSGAITQAVADNVVAASKYADRTTQLVRDFGWVEPDTDTYAGDFKLLRYKTGDDNTVICEFSVDSITEDTSIPDTVFDKDIAEGSTLIVLHNNIQGDSMSQLDTVKLVYNDGAWEV